MTPRRKRFVLIGAVLAGVATATGFALRAFNENLLYFYSPTQVLAGEPPRARVIRVGGLVMAGSVVRAVGSLTVTFDLTDLNNTIRVTYTGVLPDLFREGQGVVARGQMGPVGDFVAEEVLAKHDENYMPPEVEETLYHGKAPASSPK
jgi:cytochrome c-type biogenesis protein CcmE